MSPSTEIRIHWRRYGKGGRWRAEFPLEPGETERGSIESNQLDLVRLGAQRAADRHGWTITEEPKP
jgi:hypothetical protein